MDRYVALKVLHSDLTEDASFTSRFQREGRLVAKLDHPNIVSVYDFSEQDGYPYLVMKYIEGETLKARLGCGPLTAEETMNVVESVNPYFRTLLGNSVSSNIPAFLFSQRYSLGALLPA